MGTEREAESLTLKGCDDDLPELIQSPLAYISPRAQVADGTIVMHHALINAGARVGRNCIINTKTLVEHDAVIEDHCLKRRRVVALNASRHTCTGVCISYSGRTDSEASSISSIFYRMD